MLSELLTGRTHIQCQCIELRLIFPVYLKKSLSKSAYLIKRHQNKFLHSSYLIQRHKQGEFRKTFFTFPNYIFPTCKRAMIPPAPHRSCSQGFGPRVSGWSSRPSPANKRRLCHFRSRGVYIFWEKSCPLPLA